MVSAFADPVEVVRLPMIRSLFVACIFQLFFYTPALAVAHVTAKLPGQAEQLLPVLAKYIDRYWPSIPRREFPAGIIDQESHWNPNAKLKTSIEFGCGLGQFTKTFKKDGSVRFDTISDMKRANPALAGWNWDDCYAVDYQIQGTVLKLKTDSRWCSTVMFDGDNTLKCTAAGYNGGNGNTAKRVYLCRATAGCNPKIWSGNLELYCPQSKKKIKGYGESMCETNSNYPGRVFTRMKKFEGLVK